MTKEKDQDAGAILGEITHPGRPKDEEPHVKRSAKKKKQIVDYLVRVDLDELGIDEKQFEELQELFKMFDNDRDGVLSLKEFERLMGVLGRTATEEKAKKAARDISVDKKYCSVSFNEYLTMMGNMKNNQPTEESLLDALEVFDKEGRGRISVEHFTKIMMRKLGDDKKELDEMLAEYRRIHKRSIPETPEDEEYIDYRRFVEMLQQ